MENNLNWLSKMHDATFQLNIVNPHESDPYLQEYLSFYKFDTTSFDEYRCGTIKSHGRNIFMQAFLKRKEKRVGRILFVHGYLDHTGGMSQTVNELLTSGYEVVTIDLPGHGFSQGEKGTIATFDQYVEAIQKAYQFINQALTPSKLIGLGHSTGGSILFHAASEKKVELDSLILVAPLYYPYRWNLVRGASRIVGKVIPKQKRRFRKNSQDKLYRQFIKKDPLQVKWLKADWITAMEDWQKHIVYCSILRIPVYFIQGGKDTTVDYQKNVTFFKQKCSDLQVAFFPSGRHQLLNEQEDTRALVYERITSFLSKV
ncbi:alpha/beta fold hydrolase [Salipaludibacillus sp. HK11]|uniref:alpha/beta fold hydrolase n=1 Tax=Salipaludibacillus sp. HK11 TaxID=3394320 RepID=UPI0039FDCD33